MSRSIFVVVCSIVLAASGARAAEVRVLATGVYETSLRDLAAPFKEATGHELAITITNAGGVLAKLAAGEAADVVMTSAAGVDTLVGKGQVAPETRTEIARMRLGAAVKADAPVPTLATDAEFRAALLASPAVAYIDPKGGGTSGVFFEKMFERLGVADAVHAKGVLCATGIDIVKAVASGRATIGMTQASEIIGPPGIAFAGFLPDDANLVTPYAAGIATNATAPTAAAAMIAFVKGPIGTARLRRSGWDVDAPRP